MRKIMDTLVTDFPVSTSMTQEENRKGQANQAADDKSDDESDEEKVEQTSTLKARIHFDGLNYKMRLRKEETVLKIINLSLDYEDVQSSIDQQVGRKLLEAALVDFQVIHQGNELIFKHSFGTEF